jgi:hypothetical protein
MVWGLFKQKLFLDPDDEVWQLETWKWLLDSLGGLDDLKLSPLVMPSRVFFPPTSATGHERAEYIFGLVKQHARLNDWSCRLVAQPQRPGARVGEVAALKFESGQMPLGTFGVEGNQVVITYDPASLDNPGTLVATLAHELAHYLLATLPEPPPGGPDNLEFATDLTTVYLGFGVFGANLAFHFEQHQDVLSQGWSWSRQGYLSQREWCFALATFFVLRQKPVEDAKPFLKDHVYSDVSKAMSYLQKDRTLLAPLLNANPLSGGAKSS